MTKQVVPRQYAPVRIALIATAFRMYRAGTITKPRLKEYLVKLSTQNPKPCNGVNEENP